MKMKKIIYIAMLLMMVNVSVNAQPKHRQYEPVRHHEVVRVETPHHKVVKKHHRHHPRTIVIYNDRTSWRYVR